MPQGHYMLKTLNSVRVVCDCGVQSNTTSYLADRDIGHHRVFTECATAHEVVDGLTLACEPGCPIWHYASPLGVSEI